MYLYLVQHGISHSKEVDPVRELTPEGMEETKRMSMLLTHHGESHIQEIWHSTKERSKQTAQIISNTLNIPDRILEHNHLSPTDDIKDVYQEINYGDKNIMVVGHLPFLDHLLMKLLNVSREICPIQFRNSAILALKKEGDKWVIEAYISPDYV